MPVGIYTPGPLNIFVQGRGDGSASYLGTCVTAPEPEEEQFKIPIMNDLGGRSVPFQLVQDGSQWLVQMTLNRFDLNVCRAIQNLQGQGPGQGIGTLGQETGTARGTLVLGLTDFQMIIVNSYAGTPSAGSGAGALNAARGWYSCTLLKYKESTAGTRVLEVSLAIQCNNLFVPSARGFLNYTESGPFNLGPIS